MTSSATGLREFNFSFVPAHPQWTLVSGSYTVDGRVHGEYHNKYFFDVAAESHRLAPAFTHVMKHTLNVNDAVDFYKVGHGKWYTGTVTCVGEDRAIQGVSVNSITGISYPFFFQPEHVRQMVCRRGVHTEERACPPIGSTIEYGIDHCFYFEWTKARVVGDKLVRRIDNGQLVRLDDSKEFH